MTDIEFSQVVTTIGAFFSFIFALQLYSLKYDFDKCKDVLNFVAESQKISKFIEFNKGKPTNLVALKKIIAELELKFAEIHQRMHSIRHTRHVSDFGFVVNEYFSMHQISPSRVRDDYNTIMITIDMVRYDIGTIDKYVTSMLTQGYCDYVAFDAYERFTFILQLLSKIESTFKDLDKASGNEEKSDSKRFYQIVPGFSQASTGSTKANEPEEKASDG